MKMVTRSQWRAKPPSRGSNKISPSPKGTAVHWEGPKMGSFSHDKCAAKVRGIQAFHMHTRGYADIAYNFIACPHGYVFECRGLSVGSGANGTTQANYDYYAVCALMGEGDAITAELLLAINDAVLLCQTRAAKKVTGHRDHISTSCPGPDLYAAVQAGKFGKPSAPASAIPSLPAKPVSKPAPKPASKPVAAPSAPKFPLKGGYYFGPKSGPTVSVSGYFSNRAGLKVWQTQMKKRGWSINVDGYYTATTEKVTRQFQSEKKLGVDGKIGPATWAAAWKASVT